MWRTDGRTDRQTDGRTDRQTENTICRAAWSQLKTIGHLFYSTSSKPELQSGNTKFGSKIQNRWFFGPCDLEIWQMPLRNNMAPLLCLCKLYASTCSHLWNQTGVTVQKRPNLGKKFSKPFFLQESLTFDLWPLTFWWISLLSMTTKTTRTPAFWEYPPPPHG